MSIIANNLLQGDEGYNISRSLRFRSSASAYLNRTPASNGSGTTFTWSGWIKRGILGGGNYMVMYSSGSGDANVGALYFGTDDKLNFLHYNGSMNWQLITTQVFRDPSAWYHIVAVVDTTQATSSNRIKLYVNSSQITTLDTATYPSQNYASPFFNQTSYVQFTGRWGTWNGSHIYDGYLSENNFIDGQALTPSSFGETDPITGVWKAKKYGGTYGTNGFYLPFTDNSALTTSSNAGLGKDFSGNGNYWTTNNISITSGSTYDSMTDVPTLTSATAANYAVLNPLTKALSNGGTGTTSNGNLTIAYGATNWYGHKSSIAVTSGKWYYEVTNTTGTIYVMCGFTSTTSASETSSSTYRYRSNGEKVNSSYTSYGASWSSAGDICGVAFDLDAGTITFYKNGVSQGTAFSSIPAGEYAAEVIVENSTTTNVNFGQRPFAYTPPTGFVALNTFNLPEPSIKAGNNHFDVNTWTGNDTTQVITNGGFQPDLIWGKSRSYVYDNALYDSVRGITNKVLVSNGTGAEGTYASFNSVNSTGFSLNGNALLNESGKTYVGWQWKAGNSAGSSNTAGSITSTVSANPTAGFSVVTYTGNSTNPSTIGHGLGVAPQFIIIKNRSNAYNWVVGAKAVDGFSSGKQLYLNTTSALVGTENFFSNTQPTSSVFTVKDNYEVNFSGQTYVAYCFAEVAGYSKFGSYTGNGSADGPFVHLGFRPKFIMVKCSSTGGTSYNWALVDSTRSYANLANHTLAANLSDASGSFGTGVDVFGPYNALDLLSNGFKIRDTGAWANTNGATYVYMAFAENPMKYSLAR